MKKQIFILAEMLFAVLIAVNAQEAVVTTGGEASSTTGSVSYSVGQVFYTTIIGTNGNSVSEGVQQPYEIFVATAIPEAAGVDLKMSAYPNPVKDHLTLKISGYESYDLYYRLFDLNGKLLKMKKIKSPEIEVIMQNMQPGVYFLKVTDDKKEIKVFKIIKK
jgi:predicted Zn-dependent protease